MNPVAFSEAIRSLETISLRRRPEAATQARLAESLIASFAVLSQDERSRASSAMVGADAARKLIGLSGLLAEVAVNARDTRRLGQALALHAIEGFQTDPRENIRYLVLIAHAARKLGASLRSLIALADELASPAAKVQLESFVIRDEREPSRLSSFGIQEGESAGAFRFVPLG